MKKALVILVIALLVVWTVPTLAQDTVEIDYWLWDTAQLPGYEACAVAFEEQNPTIDVVIQQFGWGDYWTGLQTDMISGSAPDVFTNWIGQTPEFVERGQIVDIQPLIERDNVPTDIYIGSSADLWVHGDSRYALPKDWDTVGIIYNADMFEAAGIDPEIMETWTWNPDDGGTFEEIIAQLTLDENGNNALSPDFDADSIVQYGYIPEASGDAYGKSNWSPFAMMLGFEYQTETWGTEYLYDSPALVDALEWFTSLWLDKNYAPPATDTASLGAIPMFLAGEGAMVLDGNWSINTYLNSNLNVGFGKIPIGPEGLRRTATNSLGDSIWTGTDNPEEAWEWVKFLGSEECQVLVGETGAIFPAIPAGTDASLALREEQGVDVSAFVEMAAEPGVTYFDPTGAQFSVVSEIISETLDSIYLGEVDDIAGALADANAEINEELN